MAYVGGLRARLIKDNLSNLLEDHLTTLGWFNSGRQHLPVQFLTKHIDEDEEILPNVVSIVEEDVTSRPEELGSNFSSHIWTYFVDVYAENHSLGLHLATDIKDLLEGRFSSISTDDTFVVYDLTQATPTELFSCEIEGVQMDRVRVFNKPYQKYWWTVGFAVIDEYTDETG